MPKIRFTLTYEYKIPKDINPEVALKTHKASFKSDGFLFEESIANLKGTKIQDHWEIIP